MNYEFINKKKRELGLTNPQIAKQAGITLSTLDKITSGVNQNPKLNTLQSIADVIGCKLDDFDDRPNLRSTLPAEALELAKKYWELDTHGKRVVDFIVDAETDRCKEEHQRRVRAKEARNVIPFRLSIQSVSAGTGIYLGPEEFENIYVQKNDLTSRASFGVPVSGDSMEPLYKDGDLLIVEAAEVPIGKIGVFTIEGEGYVKKRGTDSLISLNPEYDPISLNNSARCNGRVIGILNPEWIVEKE